MDITAERIEARARRARGSISLSRQIILVVAFLASVAAGYYGYGRVTATQAPTLPNQLTTVRRGSIAATSTISGSTAAVSQAKLAFESPGRLAEVRVKAGDSVKSGDALARLDSADLELQVAQAEVSLEQAKVKLAQLKEGPKEVEVAAARANYDTAVTKYNDLKASPKPEDVAAAQGAVRDAEVALSNARNSLDLTQKSATVNKNIRDRDYERIFYDGKYGETLAKYNQGQASKEDLDRDYSNLLTAQDKLDSAKLEAELALRKAENDVAKAEDTIRKAQDSLQKLLAGPTPDQLKSAEAAMLTAQSQLETKSAGSSTIDITAQETAVRLAEATLKQKQLLLQKSTLLAPFDGVIDSVNVNVGEQVTASKEVVTIVNLKQFRVDARVDEAEVARLEVGQTAVVTLDALPNDPLRARVASIAANAVTQQGVVSYPMVLALDPTQASVRPGMTASVAVEVARRENALLVPNRTIRTQGRSRTVEVMVNGKPETRQVTVGMSNDQMTEITEGLQEGEEVVIPATTAATPRTPAIGGFGGGFGGGAPVMMGR